MFRFDQVPIRSQNFLDHCAPFYEIVFEDLRLLSNKSFKHVMELLARIFFMNCLIIPNCFAKMCFFPSSIRIHFAK